MDYIFNTLDRTEWLKSIAVYKEQCVTVNPREVVIKFDKLDDTDKLEPVHIVSLACLIEFMYRRHIIVRLDRDNKIGEYLFTQLRFRAYWGGKQNYVPAEDDKVFNLWRYVEEKKENMPELISNYLKKRFFKHKDLSAVKLSLDEAFYNISDHAKAEENAFSIVRFHQATETLHVAICDFGRGICDSVRSAYRDIESDREALMKAMERNFTTRSTKRNMGFGMDSIRGACSENDSFWIFSNNAKCAFYTGKIQTFDSDFRFPGTIIFYQISLSHFENEDIYYNFEDIF